MPPSEFACRLKFERQPQHSRLTSGHAGDLQTQWQPFGIKTTWNADGRQAIVIGEHGVFCRKRLCITAGIVNRRHPARRGRQQQDIDVFERLPGNGLSVGLDVGYSMLQAGKGTAALLIL